MMLTTNDYLLLYDNVQKTFKKTMKRLFTNPCSRAETELHSFFINSSKGVVSVFYDKEELSEDVIKDKKLLSNIKFLKSYAQDKTSRNKIIIENYEMDKDSKNKCRIYWVFSSECLDSNYGTLVMRNVFHQLTEYFNRYVIKSNKENEFDVESEIIQKAEASIENYLQGLFAPFNGDMVHCLSGEYYERSECKSNMVFLPHSVTETFAPMDLLYHFDKIAFEFKNIRLIRKLLEITQDDLYLVLGAENNGKEFRVLGICDKETLIRKTKTSDNAVIPCLMVKIKKHMQWDLFLNFSYILTGQNGHYKINRSLQDGYLIKRLTDYFGHRNDNYKRLIKNIKKSTEQPHGTMLVIMYPAAASEEARRLGDYKYGFAESNPHVLTNQIKQFNSIDGSVLMDTNGKVHGIGMILDGLTKKEGKQERGARYNSAKKYIYSDHSDNLILRNKRWNKVMILVVSEDDSVDILPDEGDEDEIL